MRFQTDREALWHVNVRLDQERQGAETEALSYADAIMHWLLKHPLQRQQDLALALNLHQSTISRQLERLDQQGVLATVSASYEAHPSRWYALSPLGIRRLARNVGVAPSWLAQRWQTTEKDLARLALRLPVLVQVQTVLHRLIADLPTHLGVRGYSWDWERSVPASPSLGYAGDLLLDAVLTVKPPSRGDNAASSANEGRGAVRIGLLIDPGFGLAHLPEIIGRRLFLLVRKQAAGKPSDVPTLLILTPTLASRERWQHHLYALGENAFHGAVTAWPTTPAQTDLPIWDWGWCDLRHPTPCNLREVLVLDPSCFPEESAENANKQHVPVIAAENQEPPPHANPKRNRVKRVEIPAEMGYRHLPILQELAAHPFMLPRELAQIRSLETESLSRYLVDVQPFIERITTRYGCRLCLSEQGCRLLAALWGVEPTFWQTQDFPPGQGQGRPSVHRSLRQRVEGYAFVAAARSHRLALTWWEIGPACVPGPTLLHPGAPDAAIFYEVHRQKKPAWISWQTQIVTQAILQARIAEGIDFAQAYLHHAQENGMGKPIWFWVVANGHQEQQVQTWMTTVPRLLPMSCATTTQVLLAERGPLAAIWTLLPIEQHGASIQGKTIPRRPRLRLTELA
jgi:DNA-binding MarR family transcriptional regulator